MSYKIFTEQQYKLWRLKTCIDFQHACNKNASEIHNKDTPQQSIQ